MNTHEPAIRELVLALESCRFLLEHHEEVPSEHLYQGMRLATRTLAKHGSLLPDYGHPPFWAELRQKFSEIVRPPANSAKDTPDPCCQ